MPMRPLVGRGYAPDTRAVSEAVAPMANACDPRTKVRTKSRRGRSPDLRDPSLMPVRDAHRSEEHTSELQSLMRISYAVFCLKKKKITNIITILIYKTLIT